MAVRLDATAGRISVDCVEVFEEFGESIDVLLCAIVNDIQIENADPRFDYGLGFWLGNEVIALDRSRAMEGEH